MPTVDKYQRKDMLEDLAAVTEGFDWRLPVSEWVCDCGCDNASWCQRVSAGMAYYQQAWPQGVQPKVLIFESREDIERWLNSMKLTPVATNPLRLKSFCDWVWKAWASGEA